jgi:3-hydroxyacyl-CoA dehydrogenase
MCTESESWRGDDVNDTVRLQRHGDIGVVTVLNPPVNAISHAVREGLVEALERAGEDPDLTALVLLGDGRTFMAGADIREFARPWAPPGLPEVVDAIEASRKPVVALIHGTALGGGLEIALGCHYRVALPDARLGFPEVRLGLIPGAQGTQRLPRLTGVAIALEMIIGGEPVSAERAHQIGVLDAIVEPGEDGRKDPAGEAMLEAGIAAARTLLSAGSPPPRVREMPIAGDDNGASAFAAWRERIDARPGGRFAPQRAVDAVQAAVELAGRPDGFERGVERERELFEQCLASSESAALRHVFFGEREVGKIPGLDRTTPARELKRAGVIGGGTMGTGITIALLDGGFDVVMVEAERKPLARAFGKLQAHYERAVAKGRISEEEALQRTARLQGERDIAALGDCDLVIEAVFEDLALKRELFAQLDRICRQGAILATNTSTLDVNAIAAQTSRPEDVVGLHFFSPANVMRLLEIVRAAHTADDVLATALGLAKRLGKIGVVAGVCDGFIGNRMFDRYLKQMDALLLAGSSPAQIDAALERFGFRLGPCKVADLAGIDVGYRIHQQRAAGRDSRVSAPADFALEAALYAAGRCGQKTGAGFYRYEAGGYQAQSDPAVDRLIAETAQALGIARRQIGEREIVERCVLALIDEGARILEEGIALRAVDIDIVYLHGYGFPAWRGGPMHYANELGLPHVRDRLTALCGERDDASAAVAPLIARLAEQGGRFE